MSPQTEKMQLCHPVESYDGRQQTPSDDLDAYHHNRIKVLFVIGYPTLPGSW